VHKMLEVQVLDDEPVLGLEPFEHLVDELPGRERVIRGHFVLICDRGVQYVGLALGQVRPPQLRPTLLGAQVVDAGGDRYPGHPVGERHGSLYWSIRVNIFRNISWARSSSETRRGRGARAIRMTRGWRCSTRSRAAI